MDARSYLFAFKRMWAVVLVSTLLGGAAAGLVGVLATPVYIASSDVLVGDADRTPTVVATATSTPVMRAAARELDDSATALQARTQAVNLYGTFVVRITVTGATAEDAARGADAVADAIVETVTESSSPALATTVEVIREATLPSAPASPDWQFLLTCGLALGLAVGAVTAVIIEYRRTRVLIPLDLALLGVTPALRFPAGRRSTDVDLADRLRIIEATGVSDLAVVAVGVVALPDAVHAALTPDGTAPSSMRVRVCVGATEDDAVGAALAARDADAALLVARSRRTTKRDVRAALMALDDLGVPVVGSVVFDLPTRQEGR